MKKEIEETVSKFIEDISLLCNTEQDKKKAKKLIKEKIDLINKKERVIVIDGIEHEVINSGRTLEYFINKVHERDRDKAIELVGALKMYSSVSLKYADTITILEDISNGHRVLSTRIGKDNILKTIKSLSMKLELDKSFVIIK